MQIPKIQYEKFHLDNGLTVIVHEDHKAPLVAVNLWYHVGSQNEPEGKSGFAHLFEHLMFNGSENFNDDYFQILERIGATDLNGTTSRDRTNYFQTVPKNAIDIALWMESDRMGHLLGAIDQEKLDEQRAVVQNEKRQGENAPYGKVFNYITEATYPKGHPYAHTVIGSMEDISEAELKDVEEWFSSYYGPNNAVLSIAGDITVSEARRLTEKYFGDIPPGPPVTRFDTWIAKRTGTQRQITQDRVPQARIYKVWNVPERYSKELHQLGLLTSVLSTGKNSRLYKRLVYSDQIATSASAYLHSGSIGSQLIIQATAHPGVPLNAVESAIDEELSELISKGPTPDELRRILTQIKAGFIYGMERIGGFGGKSDILASSEIYGGSPDAYLQSFNDKDAATPETVKQTAEKWLSDGVYILEVHPFTEHSSTDEGVDRSILPKTGPEPKVTFPELHKTILSNGLKIVLAQRHSIPSVSFALILDAGYASDQGIAPGTASMVMGMLDEGTTSLSALEINERIGNLGSSLRAGVGLDGSSVNLTSLVENLEHSLDLYADIILNPSFAESELERVRAERLAGIQREQVTPIQMALRVMPKLYYGSDHAYSNPLTGSGTIESVTNMTHDDLQSYYQTWFKPNHATMVIVGDTNLNEIVPLLEARLGAWKADPIPEKNISTIPTEQGSRIYLMHRPEAQQSIILAGHLAPPRNTPNNIGIETMNTILGGAFTSRINMNLREDKGWCYGANSLLITARGQRPFLVFAPIQSDKTKESMIEIKAELEGILGNSPATEDEVLKAQESQTLALPGLWETNDAISSSIQNLILYDLPENYYDTYPDQVRSMNVETITSAAHELLKPNDMIWLIVGDLNVIESGIRELNYGPVSLLDPEGNLVGE
ncbi:MAG: pitrilysin family protein [Bacteroidetes bacterium]|nr:pitrilysin family protein [Bacteroidota bacterium]MCY4234014.1 pitrilysin family protein [Bacteroidota bacterium]